MTKWVKRFSMAACALLLSTSIWAADDSDITVTSSQWRNGIGKDIVWFSGYDLGGQVGSQTYYVYNDQAGSSTTDGVVESRNYSEDMTIQTRVTTLGSGTIDVRWEGRAGTGTAWGLINEKNFTVATSIDHLMTAPAGTNTRYLEEIRVGIRANTSTGTDSVTITGIIRGER